MVSIGIDVGTTTVSACAVDTGTGRVLRIWTQPHGFLPARHPWEQLQSVEETERLVRSILAECAAGPDIACLGLTGQMHGILYLDERGRAVSPLITWQDGRGDLPMPGSGETYAQALRRLTGYPCATGYGAVTHYYNVCSGAVPPEAAAFCTIQDYLFLRLTGGVRPVTHPSDGDSLGLYDRTRDAFDAAAIRRAGLDLSLFPSVSRDCTAQTIFGFPAAVAIGDNQACFHGAVREPRDGLLLSVGTSAQISCWTDVPGEVPGVEARPYVDHGRLLSGASLCGGRAYALLAQFCRQLLDAAGDRCTDVYGLLNRLAADGMDLPDPLLVDTAFSGTRLEPTRRGAIRNIGTGNFTPERLAAGFLQGCVDELRDFYRRMEPLLPCQPRYLVGCGNGLRRNPVLQQLFARTFGMELRLPAHREEAAYGAALFAMIRTMPHRDPDAIRGLIAYAPQLLSP